MKKVIGYPCQCCEKLTNGKILVYQYVSDNLTIIRFKTECCHREIVRFFNPQDLNRYVKEVNDDNTKVS